MKKCSKCQTYILKSSFYKNRSTKDGLAQYCISCMTLFNQLNYKRYKNKIPKKTKAEKEKIKDKKLRKVYGISLVDYKNILYKQNNVCAICKKFETKIEKKSNEIMELCVDHCHTTGKVRGLLCQKCNFAIGLLKDNLDLIMSAYNYIKGNI